jgi:CHASE2 domain-containing sensor protein/tRNA A-37 threonylcarbamoyl transferase component Bud32
MLKLSSLWKSPISRKIPWGVMTVLGVSLGVTGLALGAKNLGWLETGELAAYDRSVRWRGSAKPDPRLLIVGITEEDIDRQKAWPLPDRTIAQVIQKLTDGRASLIGLDVFRANPVNPGHAELVEIWNKNDKIIPVCQHRNLKNPGIAGPPGIPPEQLGYVDLLIDPDSVVRRALLFVTPDPKSPCTSGTALSLQLAQEYLFRKHNLQGQFDAKQQFQLGSAHFKPLTNNDGGYQQAEAGGYQILLNYRSPNNVAPIVSVTDVLTGRVDPKLIKDRIVLIGSTASSLHDDFITPYSAGKAEDAAMPGVMMHAQITSQVLSAVLDKQPLWWFIPEWMEGLWIGGWCLTGSLLAWYVRHPVRLLIVTGGAAILLVGGFAIAFINMGWLPLLSPLVGLIFSSIGVLGLTSYQTQQKQQDMASLASSQEEIIAELKQLLRQTAPTTAATVVQSELQLPGTRIDRQTEQYPTRGLDPKTQADPRRNLDPTLRQDVSTELDPNQTIPYQPSPTRPRVQSPIPSITAMPPDYLLDGRYQAEFTLGSGGFGITYLARDTKRPGKPQCVIKQLAPARRDANFVNLARRLFNTEAEILSKLGHHPQIPHLLAYFEHQQEFYLVQEYIDGTPLDRELEAATEPWREDRVVDLLKQLLPVLGFVHSQYVIHRDLKPGNIIRDRHDGKLVLIDFGAVKEIQPQIIEEQSMTIAIGTRGYTPPEQYAGKPNFSSDIYALGTIAIEALTNTHPRYLPVDDKTGNLIWHDLAAVSPALAKVIDKMVTYHFNDRYQSATAVLMDLPT